MVHLLCSVGYGVEQYASAAEFLTAADITQADCLVVDVDFGDITGLSWSVIMFDLGYSFPVVFMTGSPEEDSGAPERLSAARHSWQSRFPRTICCKQSTGPSRKGPTEGLSKVRLRLSALL